ncbi:DsbA family oxidoreductase [Mangrovihabitans endophyticus]|uniref:DsbA family oxidoreductase n=1 Tax=Mangrovihabitans endophyticus TaxID=1751298 RepID=UPI00166C089A|nr:DsbA family oxidoreductase [Mangrovihabitans endophyticus]
MDIQVWSDITCPWCYLGKRRLEAALAGFGRPVRITYRAFQLDPSPPPRRMSVKQALAAKLGGPARAERMFAQVTSLAASEGLILDFDRAVATDTFDAHRLVAWAARHGRQADMVEVLHRAHFTQGIDVGSFPDLAALAGVIGLDRNAALHCLVSGWGADMVRSDLVAARDLGITSVPTFVIDGRFAVQGAQEVAMLREALAEIQRREIIDTRR